MIAELLSCGGGGKERISISLCQCATGSAQVVSDGSLKASLSLGFEVMLILMGDNGLLFQATFGWAAAMACLLARPPEKGPMG